MVLGGSWRGTSLRGPLRNSNSGVGAPRTTAGHSDQCRRDTRVARVTLSLALTRVVTKLLALILKDVVMCGRRE